jgi:hypothetical protein
MKEFTIMPMIDYKTKKPTGSLRMRCESFREYSLELEVEAALELAAEIKKQAEYILANK